MEVADLYGNLVGISRWLVFDFHNVLSIFWEFLGLASFFARNSFAYHQSFRAEFADSTVQNGKLCCI